MSSLLELLLAVAFVLSYYWKGIYVATEVLMVGSVLVFSISWWRSRKVKPMPLIIMVLALVLGGATLLFRDPAFVKWKFSVVEWLFGTVLLASQWLGRKSFLRLAMEENLKLPEPVWTRLNLMWGLFFLFLGTLNVYVIYAFSTEGWVRFKFYGSTALIALFAVAQSLYLSRHMEPEDKH